MAGLRLLIVRHGETVWNREGRFQGHTDVPLSEVGVRQAQWLAARLTAESLTAVWSSDLERARTTAEIVAEAQGLPVQTTPLLREMRLGNWEGLTARDIAARGEETLYQDYLRNSVVHRPPDAEPLTEVWERMQKVQQQLHERYAVSGTTDIPDIPVVVVVGHGGSLRVLLCAALDAPLSSLNRIVLDNASLSRIDYSEHRVRVYGMNDTSHWKNDTLLR